MATVSNWILKLSSDGTSLTRGLANSQRQIANFAKTISASLLAYQAKRIIDLGSRIYDMSKQWGIGTAKLQEWEYAAKQAGGTIEDVGTSFKFLQKSIANALGVGSEGGDRYIESFNRLGVSIDDIKRMTPEALFDRLANNLQKIPPSAIVTSDSLTLLGKSGDKMLGLFREGFAETAKSASDLGLVLDSQTIVTLKETGDQITQIASQLTSVLAPAVGFVIRKFRDLTDFVQISIGNTSQFLGALSAGASLKEAADIAGKFSNSILDKRIADDAAAAKKAAAIVQSSGISINESGLGDIQKAQKEAKTPAIQMQSISGSPIAPDSLARIGLYRGGGSDPRTLLREMVTQQRAATSELRGIRHELSVEAND